MSVIVVDDGCGRQVLIAAAGGGEPGRERPVGPERTLGDLGAVERDHLVPADAAEHLPDPVVGQLAVQRGHGFVVLLVVGGEGETAAAVAAGGQRRMVEYGDLPVGASGPGASNQEAAVVAVMARAWTSARGVRTSSFDYKSYSIDYPLLSGGAMYFWQAPDPRADGSARHR